MVVNAAAIRSSKRGLKDTRVIQAIIGWRRGSGGWENVPCEQSPNRIYERMGGTRCARAHHAVVGRVHCRYISSCLLHDIYISWSPASAPGIAESVVCSDDSDSDGTQTIRNISAM
jgi:hypothetical protein